MKLSLVIPCYNEALNVPGLQKDLVPVVRNLEQNGQWQAIEVIFVDDGSSDETAKLLTQAFSGDSTFHLVRHEKNKGLGAALRTGFDQATGDVILSTDSDATYPFTEIEPMLARLTSGVDVVTASPYHPDGGIDNVPAYRIFLSKGASFLYRVLVNPRLHTYTSMFRAYRRSVLEQNRHEHDGFLGVTEILVRAMLNGAKVAEHPCRLRVRRYGQSKAKVMRITRSHLNFQYRVLLYRVSKVVARRNTFAFSVQNREENK
jgi:dolichol-phosphate mannosyltransferase